MRIGTEGCYAQGSRQLKIDFGILRMYPVSEPYLPSHDLFGVSGNPTWKIGPKQGDTSSPGRRESNEQNLSRDGASLGHVV